MPPEETSDFGNEGIRPGGYPLSLWAIAVTGFLVLTVLLIFLLIRLNDEPLEFRLPAEAPPIEQPQAPAGP